MSDWIVSVGAGKKLWIKENSVRPVAVLDQEVSVGPRSKGWSRD